jgi:hypothetical protein
MQPRTIIAAGILFLLAVVTLDLYPPHRYAQLPPFNQSGYESLALADSLAHGRGFADPFAGMPTGPSAHLAPVFPAFLAFIISHTSSGPAAYFAMECCATLIVVLQICLLPLLARYLGLGFYSGVGASVLWLVARVPREVVWEQNLDGVLITVLAFLLYSALRRPLPLPRLVLCALLWGVLILLCPVALLALGAWMLPIHFARTQPPRTKLLLLLLPLLMLAPWMVRNYQTFHRFVFVRDNLGIELEVSNNSCASFSFELNRMSGCYAQHHPNENLEEVAQVAALGEVAYNQQRQHVAREWIKEHPGDFARLTAKRFAAFWMPSLLMQEQEAIRNPALYSPLRDAIVTLASLGTIGGLILLWVRNRGACVVFLVWLATFPLIYYITQYNERARIPVEWAILLPACYAVGELWKRFAPRI